jgi:hypothetical protein
VTAYLYPGDRIHITVPKDWGANKASSDTRMNEAIAAYGEMGIEVFMVTEVFYATGPEVVCVIRPKPIIPDRMISKRYRGQTQDPVASMEENFEVLLGPKESSEDLPPGQLPPWVYAPDDLP